MFCKSSHIRLLKMGMEMTPKMLVVSLDHLTWLNY
jgi:hypothetical protein